MTTTSTKASTPPEIVGEGSFAQQSLRQTDNPISTESIISAFVGYLSHTAGDPVPQIDLYRYSFAEQMNMKNIAAKHDLGANLCRKYIAHKKIRQEPYFGEDVWSIIDRYEEPLRAIMSEARRTIQEQTRQWESQHVKTTDKPLLPRQEGDETPIIPSLVPSQQLVKTGYYRGIKDPSARAPHARETLKLPPTDTTAASSLGEYEVGHTAISLDPKKVSRDDSESENRRYYFNPPTHWPQTFLSPTARGTDLLRYKYDHHDPQNLPWARLHHFRQGPRFHTKAISACVLNQEEWSGKFRTELGMATYDQTINHTVDYLDHHRDLSTANRNALILKTIRDFTEMWKSEIRQFDNHPQNKPHAEKWERDLIENLSNQAERCKNDLKVVVTDHSKTSQNDLKVEVTDCLETCQNNSEMEPTNQSKRCQNNLEWQATNQPEKLQEQSEVEVTNQPEMLQIHSGEVMTDRLDRCESDLEEGVTNQRQNSDIDDTHQRQSRVRNLLVGCVQDPLKRLRERSRSSKRSWSGSRSRESRSPGQSLN
ncbi:hypothetical protein I302_104810 [Kwoniella bestiolae CBS 10118]|uniref:Uncharacterized protein n=1 Tax=Kwoniella bestiolae CBS 10118 TaxID=1296100 RepID=A0A1B9FRQ7_9TREE|nr:hypothetical protein I302_09121 [Kwoniella bestiolae CBS 10118]OCF21442.1 hypothetical protein I302_09121 [Kwoniella bestiolae CBS 10118]